jgi:hypothetical protein
MPAATPITRQTVGRTFLVAISILGVAAIVQLGAVAWSLMKRYRSAPPVLVAQVAEETVDPNDLPTGRIAPAQPDFLTDFPGETEPAPGATVPPKPTPIPAVAPRPAEPTEADRFSELIEQGKQYRERGDTGTALTRFREAQALDSRNPRAFTEMAMTFEKMGLPDRANEQWRRVYDLGEAAGVHYAAAEAKLKAAQATELSRAVMAQGGAPQEEAAPAAARGPAVALADITLDEMREPSASRKFVMHLPIKARFGTTIDANDLVIQVRFFDVVDSARVEVTSANVSSRWGAPPPDWTEGESEDLLVTYELPAEKKNRKYFGYLVRLYYKGQLQSATGTPESLVKKFPPAPTLQNEPTP